jgi:hypothetical protein
MVERDNVSESMSDLLHKEIYTPEELSDLTGIGLNTIRTAIFRHELKANIVNHDIINVRRSDALEWLNQREEAGFGG